MLRHTCATQMLDNGVSLPVIQQWLGHRSLGSTLIYTHITDRKARDAAKRHPVNAMLERRYYDEVR
jgi:site-specific recombinase XerD